MVRSKIILRTLLCLVLVTSVVAVLPAAAQEADWLVSNERGTVGISSPAADDTISGAAVITGTAISPGFSYYKVEYSVDGDTWLMATPGYLLTATPTSTKPLSPKIPWRPGTLLSLRTVPTGCVP